MDGVRLHGSGGAPGGSRLVCGKPLAAATANPASRPPVGCKQTLIS
jgi:hypothetical protein